MKFRLLRAPSRAALTPGLRSAPAIRAWASAWRTRAAAALNHPNVVTIYEVAERRDEPRRPAEGRETEGRYEQEGVDIAECLGVIRMCALNLTHDGVHSRQLRDLVDMLTDPALDAGRHEVVWDGLGDGGRPAPTGVYFWRLEAGGGTFVRKMILARDVEGRKAALANLEAQH